MSEAGELRRKPSRKDSKVNQVFKKGWDLVIKRREDQIADLTALPIFGSRILEFDNQIPEKGLVLAVKEISKKSGIDIISEWTDQTAEVLAKESVLLVATHPQIIDVAGVIGALPTERRNIFLLGNSAYLGAGRNAAQHLIPIYGVAYQQTRNLRSRLWRKTGFESSPPPLLQTARLNIENLRIASEQVKEGSLVLVFPDGSKEKGGAWFNGIGELVRQLKDNPHAKVIFAITKGSKSRDKLRIVPKVAQLLGQTEFKVKFSEPHPVNEYLNGQYTRQSITQELRNQYNLFSSSR